MDETSELGQRRLNVEFRADRFAEELLALAYQRLTDAAANHTAALDDLQDHKAHKFVVEEVVS